MYTNDLIVPYIYNDPNRIIEHTQRYNVAGSDFNNSIYN